MRYSREVKVGALAVASFLMLYFGINFLNGTSVFGSALHLTAFYEQIGTLNKGAAIRYRGFIIGKVSDIAPDDETGLIEVSLDLNDPIPLAKDSKALIISDMFGSSHVVLQPGTAKDQLKDGDKIAAKFDGGIVESVQNKVYPAVDTLQQILNKVQVLVVKLNNATDKNEIQAIVIKLKETTDGLPEVVRNVNGTVLGAKNLVAGLNTKLDSYDPKIKKILGNIETLTDSLAVKSGSINSLVMNADTSVKSLKGLLAGIERGEGTLGAAFKDKTIYNNLNEAVLDLDSLLLDMKARPGRYIHFSVFGKKDKDDKKKK